MEWRDTGILLTLRRHGETSAIIDAFTPMHGRHAGVVRGGASRRMLTVLQPGTELDLEWRARLEDHLGHFRVEPRNARAALLLDDRLALAALNAICALLHFALPERQAHPKLHSASLELIEALAEGFDAGAYLEWELLLLGDMGFGLDLGSCAVTGEAGDLAYVSPKTGRAVSREGAGDWAGRLLTFPRRDAPLDGLKTSGHFLRHWLAPALGERPVPAARARLMDALEQRERRTR